jgi:hypothetical protein
MTRRDHPGVERERFDSQLTAPAAGSAHQENTMSDAVELADRLRPIAGKIAGWRADAERISAAMAEAAASNSNDPAALERVEETAGAIFREIDEFRLLLADIAASSPNAAGELAGVNDELHLVLMEITELSTRMYSFRQVESR